MDSGLNSRGMLVRIFRASHDALTFSAASSGANAAPPRNTTESNYVAAGAEISMEPKDMEYGARNSIARDV